MKSLRTIFAASTATFALAGLSALVACGGQGSSDEESAGALEASATHPVGIAACAAPDMPTSLDGFKKLEACSLLSLFESERAHALTREFGMPDGPYDGVPLCRKEVMRNISSKELPRGVREVGGAEALFDALKLSDTANNGIAKAIWHGKLFTRTAGAAMGDVLNYIDVTEKDINADTKRSAEAKYFHDKDRNFIVLDYKAAETGLSSLIKLDEKIIRQVYDTARLVDKERGIYLGMAYLVDKPGEFTPEARDADGNKSFAPSCFFALQKKATPIAAGDDKK